jgi:hypothetical protein
MCGGSNDLICHLATGAQLDLRVLYADTQPANSVSMNSWPETSSVIVSSGSPGGASPDPPEACWIFSLLELRW